MQPPLVSIITPTANRERFLPAIARCVQRQQVDWEWLVLDDSPVPSTFMQSLAAGDPRVRYFHSPARQSIGSKRNFLVDQARGSLIAHFDDDDHYASGYLAWMAGLLQDNGADLVKLSEFYLYAPGTGFFGHMDLSAKVGRHYELTGSTVEPVDFHEKKQIGADFILFYGFSYVYRKALMDVARYGDVDLYDDESFIRPIVQAGHNVIAVDDPHQNCLHLIHPASTSRCFSRYSMPPKLLPKLFPEFDAEPWR